MICGDFFITFYRVVWTCSYAPLKRIQCKYFKRPTPWLTPDILSAISAKHKAKRTAEHTHDPDDVDRYKSIKNGLKTMMCAAKFHYIKSLLTCSRRSPTSAATLWSEVNEIIGRQSPKSSMCSDLSLESINDFFALWLFQMVIILLNLI